MTRRTWATRELEKEMDELRIVEHYSYIGIVQHHGSNYFYHHCCQGVDSLCLAPSDLRPSLRCSGRGGEAEGGGDQERPGLKKYRFLFKIL